MTLWMRLRAARGKTPHEIMQDLEKTIIRKFKTHGGLVVEQSAEEDLRSENPALEGPTYTSRVPFRDRLIDFAGVSGSINDHKLEQQAIALSTKWGGTDYVDGFFGYFIGHEQYPNWYSEGGFQGGIYDSNTYGNLGKVIDAIREVDTKRAIVAAGSVNDIAAWTTDEQEAFRKEFFRPTTESGPANILMNEQYIFHCATESEDEVQDFLDYLTELSPKKGSLTRTRDMVNKARSKGRKAEWYHIINVNHEYRLGQFKTNEAGKEVWEDNSCWAGTRHKSVPNSPHRRRPSQAELSVQAYMALVRGATGIVYYSHTTNGLGAMKGYDDPNNPEDNVNPSDPSCVDELADETLDPLSRMPTCVSDLKSDWAAARAKKELGTKWYFGLMRFSPNYERQRKKSPMFDTVKAVNRKLKIIGAELYPVKHKPLTWDANYNKSGLSAGTTLIDQVSGSTAQLEFGQFHNNEADYVLVLNRATQSSQTIDLRFDVGRMKSTDVRSEASGSYKGYGCQRPLAHSHHRGGGCQR